MFQLIYFNLATVLSFSVPSHKHNNNNLTSLLQPENLLLDSYGVLKISDFGLSAISQQVRVRIFLLIVFPFYGCFSLAENSLGGCLKFKLSFKLKSRNCTETF